MLKNGHIVKHKTHGFRYKLSNVRNDDSVPTFKGAHASFQIIEKGRAEREVINHGFFPFSQYKIVRLSKKGRD